MADAYTATVVGAIGLAFSILALLLIIVIFVWLALLSRKKSTVGNYDLHEQDRKRGPVPHEGPENQKVKNLTKNQLDPWKAESTKIDKVVVKPEVLRKVNTGNLKEVAPIDGVKAVNGTHDPNNLHKKTSADYEVAVVSINVPASESDPDLNLHERVHQVQQQHGEVYHSEVTRFVNDVTDGTTRPVTYKKPHGYYGPFAQENDDDSTLNK